jgi:hypothetical protein
MGENYTRQNHGPIMRNNSNKPVSVALDVENIAHTDPVNRVAVSSANVGKASPARLFDNLIPGQKLVFGIRMNGPKFS